VNRNWTRWALTSLLAGILAVGCKTTGLNKPPVNTTLVEARAGFETVIQANIQANNSSGSPAPLPPADLMQKVDYTSPAGALSAYVSEPPESGKQYPAVIWLFGGFGNDIDETAWMEAPPENDQSGSAFWKSGIVTMYPSLRGGNDNPGSPEGFYGEVDDVLAAADYLAAQPFVDPDRIYLAGHSTGGTLVLLAAAASERFKAIFSFGPVDDIQLYGQENLPFDMTNTKEVELRSPAQWMHAIKTPTFIFEGTQQPSNLETFDYLSAATHNTDLIQFHPVEETDHFTILAPITQLVADKILQASSASTPLAFTESEFKNALSGLAQ